MRALQNECEREASVSTGLAEGLALWGVFAVVAIEIFVTYSRTPVYELYHVSSGGIGEGTRRTLAFAGFPTALMVLAVLPFVADRVRARTVLIAALVAAGLAGSVFWPGTLGDDRIDARPVNVLAVLGVALGLFLTIAAVRAVGLGDPRRRQPGDRGRILLVAVLFAAALPWMAADLGVSLSLPGLRSLYLTDQLRSQPGVPGLHQAVHDGHHHGMDGFLLAFTATLLSRAAPYVRSSRLRAALGCYLALLLAYGLGNEVQDFQLEQIVKRGWMTYELPMVLVPAASWAFGIVLLFALAFWTLVFRPLVRRSSAA